MVVQFLFLEEWVNPMALQADKYQLLLGVHCLREGAVMFSSLLDLVFLAQVEHFSCKVHLQPKGIPEHSLSYLARLRSNRQDHYISPLAEVLQNLVMSHLRPEHLIRRLLETSPSALGMPTSEKVAMLAQ
jgi:hypothetical protein